MPNQTIIEFQDTCCRVFHWENVRNTYVLKKCLHVSFQPPEPEKEAADFSTPTPSELADSLAQSGQGPQYNGQALRKALKDAGLKITSALALVPKHWVTLRVVTLPATDPEELAEMAHFEAERHIPFNVERHIISHHIVSSEEIQGARVLLAALDAPPAEQITTVFDIAGIHLTGVEVTTVALVNALLQGTDWDGATDPTAVLLNIGLSNTDIIILHEGEPIFARSAALGVEKIQEALSAISPEPRPSPAEEIFHIDEPNPLNPESSGSPSPTPGAAASGSAQNNRPRKIRLFQEIRKTLDYAHRENECEALSRIFISGAGVQIPALESLLERTFQVPVEELNPFDRKTPKDGDIQLQCDPSVLGSDQRPPAFAMAAGALLRDEKPGSLAIDLVPPGYLKAQSSTKRKKVFLSLGLGLLIALIGGFLVTSQLLGAKKRTLKTLNQKIEADNVRAREIRDKQTVVKILDNASRLPSPLEVLDTVSKWEQIFNRENMRVAITKFQYSGKNQLVHIEGDAMTYEDVDNFIALLDAAKIQSPETNKKGKSQSLFQTVVKEQMRLSTSFRSRSKNTSIVSFTIICSFKSPGKSGSR